jgi:fructose-1,6-bisphosphatase
MGSIILSTNRISTIASSLGTFVNAAKTLQGSLVADFHRTLFKGGIFLYPPIQRYQPGGYDFFMRLIRRNSPDQANGVALDGRSRILEIQSKSLHQRTRLMAGSHFETELFQSVTRGLTPSAQNTASSNCSSSVDPSSAFTDV